MADANMTDFYDRVRRFERMRSKGLGFEADGTIGRSYYKRSTKTGRSWLMPLMVGTLAVFVLKAALYVSVGSASYEDRVAKLQAGEGFDPVGGWLMQADPVTLWISEQMQAGLALAL